jgi:hypothetical protein
LSNSSQEPLEPPFAPDIFPIPPPKPGSRPPSRSNDSNSSISSSDAELLDADSSLPTIFGKGSTCELVSSDIDAFLALDLDLKRLNRIHHLLWMAGRPLRARPLHYYKLMALDITQTQQMDLHLLKYSNKLLLKPLPVYLLSPSFWTTHICPRPDLHASATGFLLSYIWLLTTPLDLQLAQDAYLLPKAITWRHWRAFAHSFCSKIDIQSLHQVNPRFHFGDLRLSRINTITRLRYASSSFVRGYLYPYNRYVVFFQRNFGWILVVFVFFSLVLSAMQVGVGVEPLQTDEGFRRATVGFVVFSILMVAVILGVVGAVFAVVFFFNMVMAIRHDNELRRERKRKARAARGEA